MGQLRHTCPHCGSTNSTFTRYGEFKDPNEQSRFNLSFSCGGCHQGVCASVFSTKGKPPSHHRGFLNNTSEFRILSVYPEISEAASPDHLPNNIASFFIQASKSLQDNSYDASSMMSRKTLEAAVKTLGLETEGNLFKRIEALEKSGIITSDLKEWAHLIRKDGNGAAHEEQPVTKQYAEDLLSFTEMFLTYTFTMPQRIKNKMPQPQEETDTNAHK
ncbi:MAG: DUF4145 domain-containing protein [Alphaproteobacteria bacterium]